MTEPTPTPTLGLAVVGCGQIVTHHLAALAALAGGAAAFRIADVVGGEEEEEEEDDDDRNDAGPPTARVVLRALCDPDAERRRVVAGLPASRTLLSRKRKSAVNGEGDSNGDSDIVEPRHFASLDDLLADAGAMAEIDVLLLAVPHDLHEPLALAALASGRVIVLEKPLAPTPAALDRLLTAAREAATAMATGTSGMLLVAEQSPHWEEIRVARALLRRGAIGTVVSAASYYYESMRTNDTSGDVDATGGLGWRGSLARAGGGISIDGGLHWIRPLREMLGPIEEVVAVTRTGLQPQLKMEGETLAHAIFRIASPLPSDVASTSELDSLTQPPGSGPLMATFSCNMLATAPMAHDACPYFRITGTRGEVIIHGDGLLKERPGAGGLRLYNDAHPEGKEMFDPARQGGFFLGFAGLWRRILRVVVQNDRSAAYETVARAADDVRVALAMYKSSKSRQWEKI